MKIVVAGDVLLDVDVDGQATRLCPDAPVPIVDVSTVRRRAGGAGLVATMLADDGHDVSLVTVLGSDEAAAQLKDELSGITVVSGPSAAPTPVKTRIRASGQQVVRFDEGWERPAMAEVSLAMLRALKEADAVVVADYGRGLTSNPAFRATLGRLARRTRVVWDPHPAGADPVPGVDVVTPNLAEARRAANSAGSAGEIAEKLLRQWRTKAVLVTLGEEGAVLVSSGAKAAVPIPAPKLTVPDPCGAGDRLAASLAIHLMAGTTIEEACALAVLEASSFLATGGVAALPSRRRPRPSALPAAGADAFALARTIQERGGTVVATGGCFDLLHAGHARTLAAARELGDCLIVCLNSDASVRRVKGSDRPITNQQDRSELLLALESVDAVIVFDEDNPGMCLEQLRPDVWVKGGDYDAGNLPEAPLIQSWGGRCVIVPYHAARSTTHLADALARIG